MKTVYDHWESMSDTLVSVFGNPAYEWLSYDGDDAKMGTVVRFGLPASAVAQAGYSGFWHGGGAGFNSCSDIYDTYLGLDASVADWVALPSSDGSLDWVAHEFGHAFVQHTANLEYWKQPGALNEHFADVLAAVLDTQNWTEFEGSSWNEGQEERIRSLKDPPASWPGRWFGAGLGHEIPPQPDTHDNLGSGSKDNCLVHINTGPANKAAYLLGRLPSDPGEDPAAPCLTFRHVEVCGQGRTALAWASYIAQRYYLWSTATYENWRYAFIQGARWYDLFIEPAPALPAMGAAVDAADAVGGWSLDGLTSSILRTDRRVSAINYSPGGDPYLYLFFRDDTTQQLGYQRYSEDGGWESPLLVANANTISGPTAVERWSNYGYVFITQNDESVRWFDLYQGAVRWRGVEPGIQTDRGVAAATLDSVSGNPVALFWRLPGESNEDAPIGFKVLGMQKSLLIPGASTRLAPTAFEFDGRVWVVFGGGSGPGGVPFSWYVSAPSAEVVSLNDSAWSSPHPFSDDANGILFEGDARAHLFLVPAGDDRVLELGKAGE